MKRIISLILSLTILMGVSVNFVSAETVESYREAEKFAFAIGIADEEEYIPDAYVSRAEFAEMIARLCMLKTETDNYSEWYNSVFGEDNKDEQIEAVADNVFEDVDKSLPQCEAISIVYSHGYMKGLTATHFGPTYNITFGAVAKVLVSMLGYTTVAERNGGYPNGYISTAGTLGILKGVAGSANSFATYRQCIEMFYNTLDVRMMELSYMTGEGEGPLEITDETFLTAVLGLYRMQARVEDNGISSLYGASQISDKTVKIGNITMEIAGCEYVRSYLGKNVEVFYKIVDGYYRLVYTYPVKNTEITITAEDYVDFDGSKIKYLDENGREKACDVKGAKLIYNNKVLTSYKKDIFDFVYGDITLVSTNNSTYDLIVIRDYMVAKVKKVNTDIKTLYTETHYSTMSDIKTLDLSDNNKTIMIYAKNGKSLDVSEIQSGNVVSVLVSKDKKCIEIWVSDASISDYVVEDYFKNTTQDTITVSDGQTEYSLYGVSHMSDEPIIRLGKSVVLHFNHEGNLVWIEEDTQGTDALKGFVTGVEYERKTLSVNCQVRIYTEKGKMEIFNVGEKISINNRSRELEDVEAEMQALLGETILYKTDDEQAVLKAVVTPLEFGVPDTDNRGWYYVTPKTRLVMNPGEDADDWESHRVSNGMLFQTNGNMFDRFMFYDKSTSTVFTVPANKSNYGDERKFSAGSISFVADRRHVLNGYSTDPNDITPEVITYAGDVAGGDVSNTTAFLIQSISDSVDEDMTPVKILRGYEMDYLTKAYVEKTLYIDSDAIFKDGEQGGSQIRPTDSGYNILTHGPAQISDLGAGDIIRYTLDGNSIGSIRVCYDVSTGKTFDANGGRGLTHVGYAIYVSGDYVRLTKNRPETVDMTNTSVVKDTSQVVSAYVDPKAIFVAEKNANGYVIRKGSIDDIVTYEDSGILTEYEKVAITVFHGLTIGTIIYK